MISLENNNKFQRDILLNNLTIYPLAVIDNEIHISTVKEAIKEGSESEDAIIFKDYGLKISNIKESINIKDHRFKISNVTLTLNNYEIDGERLSSKMIDKSNKEVSIFFKTQSCIYLSDCLLVYKGIIKRFDHDENKISLILEDFTDKLAHKDIPIAKMNDGVFDKNKDYADKPIPMVYGTVFNCPVVPYMNTDSFMTGRTSYIPDDIAAVTTSSTDRRIVLKGFYPNVNDTTTTYTHPDGIAYWQFDALNIYKGDYFKVYSESNNINNSNNRVQYHIPPSKDYVLLHETFDSYGNALSNPANGMIQAARARHPKFMKILPEESDVNLDGTADPNILNIQPSNGVLRPQDALDNINNPNIFNQSEWDSFCEIPNNQAQISSFDLQSLTSFLENSEEEFIKLREFRPSDSMYPSVEGRYFTNYASGDPTYLDEMDNEPSYWHHVSNWLCINAHHFFGKLRFMMQPNGRMLHDDLKIKLIQLFPQYDSVNLSLLKSWWQYALPATWYDKPIDEEGRFKIAWQNACGLTGDEMTVIPLTWAELGSQFTQPPTNPAWYPSNFSDNSYDAGGWQYFSSLATQEWGINGLFMGQYGNGGQGADVYFPTMIHVKLATFTDPSGEQVEKTIYIGQWNEETMNGVELTENEVWINIFNQEGDDNPFLYERSNFHSIFPADQKAKSYLNSNGAYYNTIYTEYEGFWNGRELLEYSFNGIEQTQPQSGADYVTNELLMNGLFNETMNDMFLDNGVYCIYIEEDIDTGVLSMLDESENIGEYYAENVKNIIKKGTIIPLGTIGRPTGENGYNEGRRFTLEEASEYENSAILKNGSDTYAQERLSVSFGFGDSRHQD